MSFTACWVVCGPCASLHVSHCVVGLCVGHVNVFHCVVGLCVGHVNVFHCVVGLCVGHVHHCMSLTASWVVCGPCACLSLRVGLCVGHVNVSHCVLGCVWAGLETNVGHAELETALLHEQGEHWVTRWLSGYSVRFDIQRTKVQILSGLID